MIGKGTWKLRPYQEEAVVAVWEYFERRTGNPLIVCPTGAGKSLILADFIARACSAFEETSAIVVTPRKELVKQDYDTFCSHVPGATFAAGIYCSGLKRKEPGKQVVFGTVQSMRNAIDRLGSRDLLFIDEAHLVPQKSEGIYRKFIDDLLGKNSHLKVIGLTATPYRCGEGVLTVGDDAIFTSVAYSVDLLHLIEEEWLSPLVTVDPAVEYSVDEVSVSKGEFIQKQLAAKLEESEDVTAEAVQQIVHEGTVGKRRSWLLFGQSIAHCEQILRHMRELDVDAEMVTGETPEGRRDQLIRRFKEGQLKALVGCEIFVAGFDAPVVDLLGVLRATKSPGLWVQVAGRGMRRSPQTGKQNCLLLDYGGNIDRHGPINAVRPPLPPRKKLGIGDAPTKVCGHCYFALVPAGAVECPECGFQFPQSPPKLKERSRQEVIATTTKEWVEIDAVEYRRHKKEGSPDSMRVDYLAGMTRVASEWVCIEHGGYASERALRWMERRLQHHGGQVFPPATVGVALETSHLFEIPTEILIDKTSKWPQIVTYRFKKKKEAAA